MLKKILYFLLFLFIFSQISYANSVSKIQAINTITNYLQINDIPDYRNNPDISIPFRDIWPADEDYNKIQYLCENNILDCYKGKFFEKDSSITKVAFLKIFYELYYFNNDEFINLKHNFKDYVWYFPYFKKALDKNLLLDENELEIFTFSDMNYFLHGLDVLHKYNKYFDKYFYGLEYNSVFIHKGNYNNLLQIYNIISNYNKLIRECNDENIQNILISNKNEFQKLYDELLKSEIQNDNSVPDWIKDKAKEYNIYEKLGESTYDFRKSAYYRKHNIKKALSKFHGLLVAPNEDVSFLKIVYDNRFRDFVMGYAIIGGKEKLVPAGGICGASSPFFEALYRSGIEILQRKAHSIFYSSLYDWEIIGLDATVFIGGSDLVFRNNTNNHILFNIYYSEDNIVNIQIWGVKHYKNITLEGPFKAGNHIRWIRIIEDFSHNIYIDYLDSYFNKIL